MNKPFTINDAMPPEYWSGIKVKEVKWIDVLVAYRWWAEIYLDPSGLLTKSQWAEDLERNAKSIWWRFVVYHRQQQEAKNAA